MYANTLGTITLTCGSFTGNTGDGIEVHAPLATLTGVFAFANGMNYNLAGVTTTVIVRNCPLP